MVCDGGKVMVMPSEGGRDESLVDGAMFCVGSVRFWPRRFDPNKSVDIAFRVDRSLVVSGTTLPRVRD